MLNLIMKAKGKERKKKRKETNKNINRMHANCNAIRCVYMLFKKKKRKKEAILQILNFFLIVKSENHWHKLLS